MTRTLSTVATDTVCGLTRSVIAMGTIVLVVENGPFAVSYDDTAQQLVVTGELDESTSAALRDAVEERSASYTRPLTIDLSGVAYLPSAAVGVLAQSLQKGATSGHPLELVAAEGTIAQRVLQVCALPHRSS